MDATSRPPFFFDFTYDYNFYQSPDNPNFNRDLWTMEIFGVYPIFGDRDTRLPIIGSHLKAVVAPLLATSSAPDERERA